MDFNLGSEISMWTNIIPIKRDKYKRNNRDDNSKISPEDIKSVLDQTLNYPDLTKYSYKITWNIIYEHPHFHISWIDKYSNNFKWDWHMISEVVSTITEEWLDKYNHKLIHYKLSTNECMKIEWVIKHPQYYWDFDLLMNSLIEEYGFKKIIEIYDNINNCYEQKLDVQLKIMNIILSSKWLNYDNLEECLRLFPRWIWSHKADGLSLNPNITPEWIDSFYRGYGNKPLWVYKVKINWITLAQNENFGPNIFLQYWDYGKHDGNSINNTENDMLKYLIYNPSFDISWIAYLKEKSHGHISIGRWNIVSLSRHNYFELSWLNLYPNGGWDSTEIDNQIVTKIIPREKSHKKFLSGKQFKRCIEVVLTHPSRVLWYSDTETISIYGLTEQVVKEKYGNKNGLPIRDLLKLM